MLGCHAASKAAVLAVEDGVLGLVEARSLCQAPAE